jgi:predicted amidohydrolase
MHKIAAIQLNTTADTEQSLALAASLVAQAAQQEAKLAVLPEMTIGCGISQTQRLQLAEHYGNGPIQDYLANLAATQKIWLVVGSIPLKADHPAKVRSACLVYNAEGTVVARYDKIHLFDARVNQGSEIYKESDLVEAGDSLTVLDTPVGRLGLSICYDIRFPEMFRSLFRLGAEIIAMPAAFTVPTGEAHWHALMRARAIESYAYLIGAGQWGVHANGRSTYGHSMIVDPWGQVVAQLEHGNGVIYHTLDKKYQQQLRTDFPVLSHQRIFHIK